MRRPLHLSAGLGRPALCGSRGQEYVWTMDAWMGRGRHAWLSGAYRRCEWCDDLAGSPAGHPLSPAWCHLWNGWRPERMAASGATAGWAS